MTPGEYVVKVTHECFVNYKCAGAAVEFETSKGRVFTYEPRAMTSKWAAERKTVCAVEGHEIIGLIIRRGVLAGTQQQPAPPGAPTTTIFAVAVFDPKHETDECTYAEYSDKSAADSAWLATAEATRVKMGRAAVLIDFKTGNVLRSAGTTTASAQCKTRAREAGYMTAASNEESVSLVKVITQLFSLLSELGDLVRTLVTTLLLGISFYLELEIKLIQGHVTHLPPSRPLALNTWSLCSPCSRQACGRQIIDEAFDSQTCIKMFSKEEHHMNELTAHQARAINEHPGPGCSLPLHP